MAKKKQVTHVVGKDGATWCGAEPTKGTPFDADACPKCAKLVRESFGKLKLKAKKKAAK